MQTVIRVVKLSKTFHHNKALHAVDLTVEKGEMVALLGPSGSGKSTLLRHLSGLITGDKTPESHVELLGNTVQRAGRLASDIRKSRAQTGYIFQQFNLLPFLSVQENVELPCRFSRSRTERATQRHGSVSQAAATLLAHLGLKDSALLSRRADTLSIGQQQRVAAARALIGQPELVIADEPTSALDADTREAFIRLLFDECRSAGSSLLFVSHDQSLAPLFDRDLSLAELNRAATPREA